MKKSDKKIDNALISTLTEVCDIAQERYKGFEWLTHFANYDRFPGSLEVVCIYDTNAHLARTDRESMCSLIKEKLLSIGIKIKDIRKHVSFDTEENCRIEHNGKWNERFR